MPVTKYKKGDKVRFARFLLGRDHPYYIYIGQIGTVDETSGRYIIVKIPDAEFPAERLVLVHEEIEPAYFNRQLMLFTDIDI